MEELKTGFKFHVQYRGDKNKNPPLNVRSGPFFSGWFIFAKISSNSKLEFLFLPKFLQNFDGLVNPFWTVFWPFSLVKHLKTPKIFARCARNFPGEFLFLPEFGSIFWGWFIIMDYL